MVVSMTGFTAAEKLFLDRERVGTGFIDACKTNVRIGQSRANFKTLCIRAQL
jgi:hypothetical protein